MTDTRFCSLWHISTGGLFEEVPEEEKEALGELFTHLRLRKNQPVYRAGDSSDTLYVVMEGRVRLTRVTEDGRELTLEILEPGDIFGELAIAGEGERTGSAEAVEDSVVCAVKRDDFEKVVRESPGFSMSLTRLMGGRLMRVENRLENLLFRGVRDRLMTLFRDLASRYGEETDGGVRIKLRLTHQEMSSLVGSTRETVTQELNNLRRAGEIATEGGHIVLPEGGAQGRDKARTEM